MRQKSSTTFGEKGMEGGVYIPSDHVWQLLKSFQVELSIYNQTSHLRSLCDHLLHKTLYSLGA